MALSTWRRVFALSANHKKTLSFYDVPPGIHAYEFVQAHKFVQGRSEEWHVRVAFEPPSGYGPQRLIWYLFYDFPNENWLLHRTLRYSFKEKEEAAETLNACAKYYCFRMTFGLLDFTNRKCFHAINMINTAIAEETLE